MKKIFSIAVVLLLSAVIFAGCDTSAQTSSDVSSSDEASSETSLNSQDYSYDFEGFLQYMTDSEYIKGDGTELSASAIGASQGQRFTISSGTSKYYVELYEFDLENMNDTANSTVSNAKTDGTFNFYGDLAATQNTVAAVTDDGRFLMLYTDTSTSESNLATKQSAVEAVQNFGK